jgi:hypothetical protein
MSLDHDDDDSAMIVYKEDPNPDDDMSQEASIPSQSQNLPSLSPLRDVPEVQCMPRRERRKRRFQWREQANRNASNSPETPDEEAPLEDAFASLQELLESQKNQSQETVVTRNVEKENNNENAMECDTPREKPGPSAPKEAVPPHDSTTQRSSPDLGLYDAPQDDHEKQKSRQANSRRTTSPSGTEKRRLEKPTYTQSTPSQRRAYQSMSVALVPSIVGSR